MIDATAPFVLFDDAREDAAGPGRLYRGAAEIVETRDPAAVRDCLARLRGAAARGLHAAGFLSYEAGLALEDRLSPLGRAVAAESPPLLWFGLFEGCTPLAPGAVPAGLPEPAGAWASAAVPGIGRAAYEAAVSEAQEHIAAGDIYQANLTFPADVRTAGAPLALYAAIRGRAAGGHGAIVFTGAHWLLSFSPELFFALDGGRLIARPMKGTAPRGADAAGDAAAAAALRDDPKQRAENLMIVDLLRNDLARVSRTGSVAVPELFSVERYPTVHQLTSTVTARIADDLGAFDVIEAIFPCGSITGAPKIRAMERIAALESGPRGPYTGSIGWAAPDGDAAFNVAIRTLSLGHGGRGATLGLGAGIVADSVPADEWRECLAKGAFVETPRRFDLIETMRFDPQDGVVRLEAHLARLTRSADALGFAFDRHAARNELQAATFASRTPRLLRLLLSRSGRLAVESRPLPSAPSDPVTVALAPLPVAAADFRLRHKTTDRAFYDEARHAGGSFETLFVDPEGFVTEGSFTNIFVARRGGLLTPPASRGLLAGVLRETLLAEGKTEEAELTPADLADGLLIGNSVRGLIPATVCF